MQLGITLIIIIVTAFVSFNGFNKYELKERWIMIPYSVIKYKEWYRVFTHALLHADWIHLIFNMYVLYIVGSSVEFRFEQFFGRLQGTGYYIVLYLGGIIVATIPSLIRHKNNMIYRSLGASGAVGAVLFTYILLFPWEEFYAFIPAWVFGPAYLILEYHLDKRGGSNVAHDAHIFGALFGIIFPILIRPEFLAEFIEQILNRF